MGLRDLTWILVQPFPVQPVFAAKLQPDTKCMHNTQVLRYKTWVGKSKPAVGNHYYRIYGYGKECLDIHLLQAAAHKAVANPG